MNKSGVTPCGDRVIVLPDAIEEVTKGGIIIRQQDRDRHQHSQMAGLLVAVGEDAWTHTTTQIERLIDNQLRVVERRTTGYSKPFAKVGDRVCFARYNGQLFDGEDGLQYRLLNDEDITGLVSDTVNFTDLKSREPLGAQG
jgi:co-chaperonin GroES (HSP10)